jgi:hypothetical protein
MGFLSGDDLFIEEGRLEIRGENAEVANVIFLSIKQLLDDHLPGEQIFDYLLDLLTGLHSSEEALNPNCGLRLRGLILCLHIQ